MKNELNAALHFVKFIKRTRNLAVTDPGFNATLENVKDVITTFQVSVLRYFNSFCLIKSNIRF